MKYSEQQLALRTFPLSETEEQKAKNAIKMIRSAINESDSLIKNDIEIFVQGSYANNTNVRTDSDVDVCVMIKDTFHDKYPDGMTREDYGFVASDLYYNQYRAMVKSALQDKFGFQSVKDGNKSIKINENTYHVKADVVPAFQLRNYYYNNSKDPRKYIEGTWFVANDGEEVSNYPKIHIYNGVVKNEATNHYYKKLVRIMKHIKNDMVDNEVVNSDIISSFLVECLVYQVPNRIITQYSSWTETVKQAIIYLYSEIKDQKHKQWTEVSEMLYLFVGHKWSDEDAKQWLIEMWNYMGY